MTYFWFTVAVVVFLWCLHLNHRLLVAKHDKREILDVLWGFVTIAENSGGVTEWHLNGDVADWDEFEELSSGRAMIAKHREGQQ